MVTRKSRRNAAYAKLIEKSELSKGVLQAPTAVLRHPPTDRIMAAVSVTGKEAQKGSTMTKTHSIHGAARIGIAGAVLVAFSVGPVMAGHGYGMKNHPLRGDFPTTSIEAEVAPGVAEAKPTARQRDEPGGWLRGDFPLAAESRTEQASPEPATAGSGAIVTSGIGETWSCTVQTASALGAGSDPAQAVMRVIHLPQ